MTRRRFWSVLSGIFSVALLLAALGATWLLIYGMAGMRAQRGNRRVRTRPDGSTEPDQPAP